MAGCAAAVPASHSIAVIAAAHSLTRMASPFSYILLDPHVAHARVRALRQPLPRRARDGQETPRLRLPFEPVQPAKAGRLPARCHLYISQRQLRFELQSREAIPMSFGRGGR